MSLFTRTGGLIGPYGGTAESEHRRPVLMALTAIGVLAAMLLGLVPLALACGDFLGPVLLIVTNALRQQPTPPTATPASLTRRRVIAGAYYAAVVITLFTIYIGGMPLRWEVNGDRLLVGWKEQPRDLQVTWEQDAEGVLWLAFPSGSTALRTGIPAEFGGGYELWVRPVNARGQFTLPLWVDTFRWLLVALLAGAELVGLLLVTRLLTEVLFPTLPNSVRAKPGLLGRLFPFMRIRNENGQPAPADPADPESALPTEAERAPRRS